MYLKRLEIYGFKTFAQRTVFEFLPGVTAIVGPNGSGKSNLADAVRWVLGEQSFANLRSKRTEDLIFGGGKDRAPMGFAEVFLTLDNSDRLLPLAYDEVTIGRRAYRSGENEYTINRARVRLRDVLDAVAPLGSSYTLINQGLVDAALALQPEERRRLFEDAAEIGPYQAKKQEAERRLRESETNLLRLNDLVSELEPQLRTLKRQAHDAEAVGMVQSELHTLLHQQYALQWRVSRAHLDAATLQEEQLTARLADTRAFRSEVLQALEAARDQIRQRRAMLEEQHEALASVQQQREVVVRELAVIQERLTNCQQQHIALEQRRRQLYIAVETAHAENLELEAKRAQLEATLREVHDQLVDTEGQFQQKLEERCAVEAELAMQREALLHATTALETERARYAQIERRLSALVEEQAELQKALLSAREHCDQCSIAAMQAQQTVDESERCIKNVTSSLDVLRANMVTARSQCDQVDDQITTAKRAYSEREARFNVLSRLSRSYEGTFSGVRAAMQWAEREKRSGFMLVSSLLHVPAKLETAIEVALGGRLQNIVVERWADAEAAITHLKRSGSGRATFLPLDTLKPGTPPGTPWVWHPVRQLSAPRLPGIRGVAADLIEVAPQYAGIAIYLLGRTLIADDLGAARQALPKLANGWTIVTLGGEQLATGGAITGGAATKESGTLRRERELRELPTQLAAARSRIDELQAGRACLKQQIDMLQLEIRRSEASLHEAYTTRDAAQRVAETRRRNLHQAEDAIASIIRRCEAGQREHAELTAQQAVASTKLEATKQARAVAQQAVSAVQDAFNQQLAVTSDGEVRLRNLRLSVATLEAELRRHIADDHSRQQAADRAAAELSMLDQEAQGLADQIHMLERSMVTLRNQQSGADECVQVTTEQVAMLRESIREAETRLAALEARERDYTSQMLALEAEHAEAAVAVQRCRSECDMIRERAAEDNIEAESLAAEAAALEPSSAAATVATALAQRIEHLRARLRRMGPVNALAPNEYRAAQARHAFLSEQLADIRAAAAVLHNAIGDLDQMMQRQFETTFAAVGREFERTFKQLFGGGHAQLVLLKAADDTASAQGIDIIAQPPGKRQLNLQLLSGGERALTAAALLFAILKVNPSPFCILDEVDAALDEANVVRFREALLELATQTQFILITHNRGTVEVADTLYGITMAENSGLSTVVALRLEEIDSSSQPAGSGFAQQLIV